MEQYYYDDNNHFIIEDFHRAKPFSSFLPGIAGKHGIPIWSFYVNRGQGITSFGIDNKDNPIMEFYPANGAYETVRYKGFRTFIKTTSPTASMYEPFSDEQSSSTKMTISKDSFEIRDHNGKEGTEVQVRYSTLSNVPFGGLIRQVTVTNISAHKKVLEIADGMPALLPYGVANNNYKEMSNLLRSWMEVSHRESKVPYYRLRSSTADEAVVSEVKSGYYYINGSLDDDSITTVYDPSMVFGYCLDLSKPVGFEALGVNGVRNSEQVFANKVPCAFQMTSCELEPGASKVLNSIIGFSHSHEAIDSFVNGLNLEVFISEQMAMTRSEVEAVTEDIKTETGIKSFDAYMSQNYLDNVLRGGKPVFFEKEGGDHVYHIYSRKHGDPERDYNFFSLEPSKYSRGNGNYRDVCQNRRNDVVMEPRVKDFNVWMFYNLVQADGYNPLSIKGTVFRVEKDKLKELKSKLEMSGLNQEVSRAIVALASETFTPGSLSMALAGMNGCTEEDQDNVLKIVLKAAVQEIDVDFGEGFWSDHFTYNLDLIESFGYMYPDKLETALFERMDYAFYNASYYVLPRAMKYCKTDNGDVRQYEAIAKKEMESSEWLVDQSGDRVHTNLFNKMLVLALTKFMNLDPFGLGLEMEADKPGWNDALNGLPGLIGSGMSETVELKRHLSYMIQKLTEFGHRDEIIVLKELELLLKNIECALKACDIKMIHESSIISFKLWDELNLIKEHYREKTRYTMSPEHIRVDSEVVVTVLTTMMNVLDRGIEKAKSYTNGILPSYFINIADSYKETGSNAHFGLPAVEVKSFSNRALPLFLEGPARYLKTAGGQTARDLHHRVKESDIYDKVLGMYKTSESLEDETMEIGRLRAFTPGWLERESVFLHMTYKYLLGLIKAQLHSEFYEELKTNFIPMLDPKVYGRSTTENSSFLASSVNPDPNVVGQGFVARLSGSTAEAISMWTMMFIGSKGFSFDGDRLTFEFTPVLTNDFFADDHTVRFRLFGTVDVTYVNKTGRDTFGKDAAVVSEVIIDGETLENPVISGQSAVGLRQGTVRNVTVHFA